MHKHAHAHRCFRLLSQALESAEPAGCASALLLLRLLLVWLHECPPAVADAVGSAGPLPLLVDITLGRTGPDSPLVRGKCSRCKLDQLGSSLLRLCPERTQRVTSHGCGPKRWKPRRPAKWALRGLIQCIFCDAAIRVPVQANDVSALPTQTESALTSMVWIASSPLSAML